MINKNLFYKLESELIKRGLDSDYHTFNEIKYTLKTQPKFSPVELVKEIAYVILVSGFRQSIAKKKHKEIFNYLESIENVDEKILYEIFNGKKTTFILDLWNKKEQLQKDFYNTNDKKTFLLNIKGIGNITIGHLVRNLGLDANSVKYDIHIQRLGCALYGENTEKINNGNLHKDIKFVCDKMFDFIVNETGEMKGYIDVVLFKSCAEGLIKIENNKVSFS
jgi:thermostable 8-oxoguanine DNA glycosylase